MPQSVVRRAVRRVPVLSDRTTAIVIGAISSLYLASGTYVGLNGHHVWRQSDSFAQILGYMGGFKAMVPLEVFNAPRALYDIPIYELVVAGAARLLNVDPLVEARFVNLLCWMLFLVAGFLVAERVRRRAGVVFVLLASTSPLFLQFFSAPIPDGMAVTASTVAVALMMRARWLDSVVAAVLLVLAALIKSPVPFVFLVFLVLRFALTGELRERLRRPGCAIRLLLPLVSAVLAAGAAESIRKAVSGTSVGGFAQDPAWYFGTLQQRLSPEFWQTLVARAGDSFAFPWVGVVVLVIALAALITGSRQWLVTCLPPLAGFFAGWLVFSNVFFIHDYYEMAVVVLLFLASAWVVVDLLSQVQQRFAVVELQRA